MDAGVNRKSTCSCFCYTLLSLVSEENGDEGTVQEERWILGGDLKEISKDASFMHMFWEAVLSRKDSKRERIVM